MPREEAEQSRRAEMTEKGEEKRKERREENRKSLSDKEIEEDRKMDLPRRSERWRGLRCESGGSVERAGVTVIHDLLRRSETTSTIASATKKFAGLTLHRPALRSSPRRRH